MNFLHIIPVWNLGKWLAIHWFNGACQWSSPCVGVLCDLSMRMPNRCFMFLNLVISPLWSSVTPRVVKYEFQRPNHLNLYFSTFLSTSNVSVSLSVLLGTTILRNPFSRKMLEVMKCTVFAPVGIESQKEVFEPSFMYPLKRWKRGCSDWGKVNGISCYDW